MLTECGVNLNEEQQTYRQNNSNKLSANYRFRASISTPFKISVKPLVDIRELDVNPMLTTNRYPFKKMGMECPKSPVLPTGCATCTTFRHRHRRQSRLIETAEIEKGKAGVHEEDEWKSDRRAAPKSDCF